MSSDEQIKRVWSLGSYPDIGPTFLPMAGHLVDAVGVEADHRVLDVACGTGNVAITAARKGVQVTALDITPAMLEGAQQNAAVAGVEAIEWREGDATDLPFEDDAFDVTLSCVGHMFARPADEAAAELLRVTRSGGQIAFTSWTPSSVVPAMAAVMQEYLPPDQDPGEPPFRWGDPDVVRDRLDDGVENLTFESGTVNQPVISPAHYWEGARTQSGLFIVALDRVDETDRSALRAAMVDAIGEYFDDRQNAVAMEYRLARATVT